MKQQFDVSALAGVLVLGVIAVVAMVVIPDKAGEIASGVVGAVSGWMAHKYSSSDEPKP